MITYVQMDNFFFCAKLNSLQEVLTPNVLSITHGKQVKVLICDMYIKTHII